jgi:hypothetical protein
VPDPILRLRAGYSQGRTIFPSEENCARLLGLALPPSAETLPARPAHALLIASSEPSEYRSNWERYRQHLLRLAFGNPQGFAFAPAAQKMLKKMIGRRKKGGLEVYKNGSYPYLICSKVFPVLLTKNDGAKSKLLRENNIKYINNIVLFFIGLFFISLYIV